MAPILFRSFSHWYPKYLDVVFRVRGLFSVKTKCHSIFIHRYIVVSMSVISQILWQAFTQLMPLSKLLLSKFYRQIFPKQYEKCSSIYFTTPLLLLRPMISVERGSMLVTEVDAMQRAGSRSLAEKKADCLLGWHSPRHFEVSKGVLLTTGIAPIKGLTDYVVALLPTKASYRCWSLHNWFICDCVDIIRVFIKLFLFQLFSQNL